MIYALDNFGEDELNVCLNRSSHEFYIDCRGELPDGCTVKETLKVSYSQIDSQALEILTLPIGAPDIHNLIYVDLHYGSVLYCSSQVLELNNYKTLPLFCDYLSFIAKKSRKI